MREPFTLPDNECERLTRPEMNAVKLLLSLTSIVNYAKDDLKRHLDLIPDGNQRFSNATEDINSILQDVLGTVSVKQTKQLLNDAKDLEVRLVPKMTRDQAAVLFYRDEFQSMVDCAREKCKFYSEDGNTCRNCVLYGILEAKVPLDDYEDDGITCPYAYREWER